MPAGGITVLDSFLAYTFVDLVGYGEGTGYLKTILRETYNFEVDLSKTFGHFGAKGDGLFTHIKSKVVIMLCTAKDLFWLMLLVVLSGKTFIHGLAKIQTRQMFARVPPEDPPQQPNFLPNPVHQPTDFDRAGDVGFVGVIERNRMFETAYDPMYQHAGLFGNAGRQQDSNIYRVYF